MTRFLLAAGLVLPLSLLACGDKDGDSGADGDTDGGDTDADTDTDGGDTDADTDTDGGSTGPSVWDEIETGLCETLGGTATAGADSFFVGEFSPGDAPTTGTETWALYANSTWEAGGGADCVVVWDVTATSAGTGACSACDFGFEVAATVDASASTCDPSLYEGDESFEVAYAVKVDGDRAVFHYAGSGNVLGEGYATETTVSYITEHSCKWF